MEKKQYYVRWRDLVHGPWSLPQVRRLLETAIDATSRKPNAGYEVRDAEDGQWLHPSDFDELLDLYEGNSLMPMTTIPATPRAKAVKD